MTRALLAALPDFAPTPLQRAALKRIGELCKELAGYGLYPRTSMELEFFVQTDGGVHMPGVVKLDKALEFLQQEGIFGLDKVETEGEARRLNLPQIAKQYEVTLDDREGFHPVLSGKRPDFHPEAIALGVLRLKQNALQRMLESSTCLQNVRGLGQLGTLLPNFDARPYPTRTDTSGLNVNISLTDREGRNMFSASLPLLYHCADGVANAQHDTLLALLPMENSVKRIGANPSAPAGIGVVTGKPTTYSPYNSVYIRGVEHPDGASNIVATDLARVENRLPGADADPFLAM
ncbi:MAG: hypothetical protein EBV03_11475, partial [Proteobacteria bacterium]|nr:hypothetical protein [Pseudomonadota bacterium]